MWCAEVARGRGVGLAVNSFFHEPPSELVFVDLAPPRPTMAINAVWASDEDDPPAAVGLLLEAAAALGAERGWE